MTPLRAFRLSHRRLAGFTLGVVATVVCAVTATAFFRAAGAGAGTASVATLQPVAVAATAGGDAPSSVLLPGGSADVIVRLQNPNAFAVRLVSVVGNGSVTADGGHPGCSTTGVTFADQTGLNISVPPGSSLVHLPSAAAMSTASSNGCQGAFFSIPVAVTVHN
jgi:hypothetical protein